jgi:GGDEF domain-containing protein
MFTGLADKLTLVFTALVLTFVVATVTMNVLGQRADQRERALLSANHLIALAKEVSIPHILTGRPSELEIFFEELEKRTVVESAFLVDPNGALLMAGQSVDLTFLSQVNDPLIQNVLDTAERQVHFSPETLSIAGPIEVGGRLIGIIKVKLSLKDLVANSQAVWVSNLSLGALFLVVGLIASRFLANKLARPLERLATAAGKVAQGDLDQHVDLHSADEFSQVGDAFNGMLSNLKSSIAEIHRVAYEDKLTGAPNRSWLNMQLEQLTLRYKHAETGFAVIFLDLDKFKAVNDTYGHHVGDQLLRAFAKRLARCLREEGLIVRSVDYDENRGLNVEAGEAILARLGGNEFTLIVPLEVAETVAKRITRVMEAPFRLEGCQLNNSTSMGIAVFPLHAVTREHLLKCADVAMYQAKRAPNNSYAYYNHATHTHYGAHGVGARSRDCHIRAGL